ncbi:EamA family transporter RarD [Sphingobium algorifonticola]|uniref:EamA family transporter RarD n=1 Tax=Sphingobium algorifonticola TaxID=2008318 RepID=A0A437JD91_9SPHN|nr:EamA family transporter RarD [Sphingobium algorifonticola]RVT43889.1 EamA family transporter RarD [Sphingobium algorifonticola]
MESPSRAKGGSGLPFGLGAYFLWGLLPLYFKLLASVGPAEIVASRVLFSLVFLIALLAATGALGQFKATVRNRAVMGSMMLSAALIGINWLAYVWAISTDHIVAASLGYFLNPLVNVLLGVVFLKERLSAMQKVAVGVATLGVAVMAASAFATLWLSLLLAISFAFYGYIRKTASVGPRQGLAAETLILTPVALAYMAWLASHGGIALGQDAPRTVLLVLSGVVTSLPLLLFATAARRMPLSTLGLLQYLSPTIQFFVAVLVFGESLNQGQIASFGLIWAGLAIYTVDSVRSARAARALASP